MEGGSMQQRPKKVPQVRQTLTSKFRMLKANPLLRYELEKKLNATKDNPEVFTPLRSLATLLEPSQKPVPKKAESCPNLGAVKKIKAPVQKPEKGKTAPSGLGRASQKSEKVEAPRRIEVGTKPSVLTTPSGNRASLAPQRTYIATPSVTTPSVKRMSMRLSIPKTPHSDEMISRLNKWLKNRGKSFGEFHHLKCFGVHKHNVREAPETKPDKENITNNVIPENETVKSPEKLDNNESETVTVQDTLQDLHKLILEGYPPEQCEIWLKLVRNKFRQVEQEPEYWECRAALEQTKGNLNLAVECYKTAIIQGAEVKVVDKCLDQLLHKFSLLDINESNCRAPDRSKIMEDARNVFKSSIIQFAVQERTFKKKNKDGFTIEKKMIATPVRRSTRLSRAAYVSTPGVQIYSTLQDVDDSVRKTLNFQCNNALREL